jgi:ectoine hydroxylase-related dioxygenase (phytanoyl-CoA dioxygenase family)
MLSDAQVRQYHEDGYVVPDFRLPDETLEAIKAHHAALLEKHPEYRDFCPALLDHDRFFLGVCDNPDILDMVAQVIGPDIALWNSSFFAKPAHDGKRTPWHQDGEYWPIRPLATCTVWVAVDDATRENGCLRVIRGSHRDRALKAHHTVAADDVTLHQELDADAYDEADAVDLVLRAGQVSLHDVFLLHGSEANRSGRPRRGMTMRFMPTASHFDRDYAQHLAREKNVVDHSPRPVFLLRGRDACGRNSFAAR